MGDQSLRFVSSNIDGTLKASQAPDEQSPRAAFAFDSLAASLTTSWPGTLGLAVTIGIAYFAATRLGLALRAQPEGVAFFWPAAGIAVGALVVLGPSAWLPGAIAVASASAASSLLLGRNIWLTFIFALVNVAQALVTFWLIERWFGRAIKLEDLRQVLGFLFLSAVGAAIVALGAGGAVAFLEAMASPLPVLRLLFVGCLLGVVTVAPVLIGLGEAVRELPPRRELIEGVAGLATLFVLSVFAISLPKGPWATSLPEILVFCPLLWVAVRCRPVFSAAAALLVALAVICSKSFNLGYFGDASIPLMDNLFATQSIVLATALVAFVLAALFAERRRSETALKLSNELLREGNERLELALGAAELGAFSLDLGTGLLKCDSRTAHIHGHMSLPKTIKDGRRFVHPDDRVRIDTPFADAQRTGGVWSAEYRVVHPPGHPHAGEVRWIAFEGSTVRGAQGEPVRLLGICRDITQRKRAEYALAERNVQLALAGKAALVGSYAYDPGTDMMQVSEGYAAIHGLREETVETSRSEWRSRAHPEDLARIEALRHQALQEQRGEYDVEYRIVRSSGEIRWIESRSFISYNSDGSPNRVIGVNIDITGRKQTDEHQRVLVAELDHRVKNVLATVSAVAGHTLETSSSMGHFMSALNGRIHSMATAHELLSTRQWRGLPIAQLVQRELAAFASSNNTTINGPEVMLSAESGQAIAMVIHELVTNAAKYGALSTQFGRVLVRWYRELNGSARLVLVWQETGGPKVEAPKKSGYGTRVVRELIPYEFGGTVDFSFAPEGVRCQLEIPFERLSSDSRNGAASERLRPAERSSSALSR